MFFAGSESGGVSQRGLSRREVVAWDDESTNIPFHAFLGDRAPRRGGSKSATSKTWEIPTPPSSAVSRVWSISEILKNGPTTN